MPVTPSTRRGHRPLAIVTRVWLLASLLVLCTLPVTPVADAAPTTAVAPGAADGPVLTESPSFSDVGLDHPFATEIGWAADNDVTGGYPDGTFRGGNPVTRQAFAAFLARYWVSPDVPATCSTKPFPDVPVDSPFCPQITWLKARGLATGYPDGTFRPGATITRQALAAVLYRFRGSPDGTDPACDAKPASDVPVDHPFCGEIAWLADVGLTTATPTTPFNPSSTTSRQAAVTFLHRLDPGCAPVTERTGGCPRPAVPGDYDGDRTADPVWVHMDWDTEPPDFSWYVGDAAEPFASLSTAEGQWYDADLDGDGRWDPAAVDTTTGTWTTAAGNPPATLPPPADCAPVDGGATPLLGDWDGDRRAEPGWYCFVDGTWHLPGRTPTAFGEPAPQPFPPTGPGADVGGHAYDVPAPADYDGDGTTDLAVYRPHDGSWWVHGQDEPIATGLGIGIPTPADLDGDGDADPLLHSLMDGRFERPGLDPIDPTSASVGGLVTTYPAVGDHDGDGIADLADVASSEDETTIAYVVPDRAPTIREAEDSIWAWMPTLFPSSSTTSIIRLTFLAYSCRPGTYNYDPTCPRLAEPGDLDGDRIADRTWVRTGAVGGEAWGRFEDGSVLAGGLVPDCAQGESAIACARWAMVPGDYDGDGRWEPAAVDTGTGVWVTATQAWELAPPPCADITGSPAGDAPGAVPVPGQWDADPATDPAWYCRTDATWHIEDGTVRTFGWPAPTTPAWMDSGSWAAGAWYDVPVPMDPDGDGRDDPTVFRPATGTFVTAGDSYSAVPLESTVSGALGLGIPVPADYDGDGDDDPAVAATVEDDEGHPTLVRFTIEGRDTVTFGFPEAGYFTAAIPAAADLDGDGTADPSAMVVRSADGITLTDVRFVEPGHADLVVDASGWTWRPENPLLPHASQVERLRMDWAHQHCLADPACPFDP